ncbi:hypothetical protein BTO20_01050 [Mycobacterium dioxanotrophicus]|uniref:Uncharacterized protein n=1 Tax=Mycobacterium dioxanotrophicus TaxID=482462 RepID=A0A1Y0BWU1_9MYCO|nr:hypothetical protein BTO20_01050 [Mycobacterium dioxanotrophicus]
MSPMLANNRLSGSTAGREARRQPAEPDDRITSGSREVSKIAGNPHRPAGIVPVAGRPAAGGWRSDRPADRGLPANSRPVPIDRERARHRSERRYRPFLRASGPAPQTGAPAPRQNSQVGAATAPHERKL